MPIREVAESPAKGRRCIHECLNELEGTNNIIGGGILENALGTCLLRR